MSTVYTEAYIILGVEVVEKSAGLCKNFSFILKKPPPSQVESSFYRLNANYVSVLQLNKGTTSSSL
jgi:hypothetical protein